MIKNKKYKAVIYTLGCKVNQYESEAIAECLEKMGVEVCHAKEEEKCDICIINTCTVTAESDRKCRQIIRRAQKTNPNAVVLLTGCYAQVAPQVLSKMEGVDYICGNKSKLDVAKKAVELVGKKQNEAICEVEAIEDAPFENISAGRSERTRAYIKIEDGCENKCTYCIIPRARGKIRSKQFDDVMEESRRLSDSGYNELVLTGIEVCAYGKEWGYTPSLIDVLEELERQELFNRVRIGSMDPSYIRHGFTDRVCKLKSAVPYYHLSLQSGCDRTLNAMKRKYNTLMIKEYVDYMREKIPEVCFTADIIVGFPGETDEDFEATRSFIKGLNLLDAHVFAYSKRDGTPAAEMKEQVPPEIKDKRSSILIGDCKGNKRIILNEYTKKGGVYPVLFETYSDGVALGRMANFIEVEAKSDSDLCNRILNVKITAVKNERLIGEIIFDKL